MTMTYAADPRVDAYIDALPAWQQAICREVRDLVHGADAGVAETIKRARQRFSTTPSRRRYTSCADRPRGVRRIS